MNHDPQARYSEELKHICVCICTFKRPELLGRLLDGLGRQVTEGRFTYSALVVDNDQLGSAERTVLNFTAASNLSVTYCIEPRQNISLTRNKAIENANGDFVAFIDDDEFPVQEWLLTLFNACREYNVDGVLGPVKPHFDVKPPKWVVKGKFYDRATYPTGFVIDWRKGRTGNVLLKKEIFSSGEQPFRPEFRTGEDQDFFRRMIERGHTFVWCNEALAYEVVPPIRWKRTFMLRRALLRGETSLLHPGSRAREIAKSIVAIPAYTLALPFALIVGQSMPCLVKLFDHLGKLLGLLGINPAREPYVTQ
jgi:glycosyltransferase involved in cell wall biosynthesis